MSGSREYVFEADVKNGIVMRERLHHLFRGTGAALALLTAASPLLSSFHDATVRHVACPEDGELIDVPVQAKHEHAQATGDWPSLFAEHGPAAPSRSGRNHDHCAIALRAHLRAREQPRNPFVVTTPEAVATVSGPQEPLHLRSLAVYRIAPKASPPLA